MEKGAEHGVCPFSANMKRRIHGMPFWGFGRRDLFFRDGFRRRPFFPFEIEIEIERRRIEIEIERRRRFEIERRRRRRF